MGMKGTFVVYSTSSKSYRFFIKDKHCIEVSIDVTFNERIEYNNFEDIPIDSNEEEEPIVTNEDNSRKDNTPEHTTNHHEEVEIPSEPIQSIIIPET